ncbi:MAG: Bug family tripartite tricarboxylate transporter substrate binding protein [Burkholderiales bacterium]
MFNFRSLFLLTFFAVFSMTAGAQNYPTKTVRLVVPFAAGGSTDIMGRLVAQKLSAAWGQQVVVDNRAGGSTVIGTDNVAKSAPDGHTLLVTPAPFTIVPSLLKKLPYDPAKDFEPITLVNTTPLVVIVHPGVPAKNIKELIALAKAKPGVLNFGSSGSGGSNHLAGELFNAMANVKITHVPYKGNGPAMTDLLGGHIDMAYNGLTSALQHIKSGKLRCLAVTSLKRTAALPDMPTLDEQGLKGFQAIAWNGLTGPAGMPKAAVAKIADDVARIMKSAELAEYLKKEGSDPVGSTTAEYTAFLRGEIAKWKKVIERAGIKSL